MILGFALASAHAKDAVIVCHYGEPVQAGESILQYPDFTVRLARRVEMDQVPARERWVVTIFDVLTTDHKTIGGDIRFNSEKRANARRFDVRKKAYLAEMYFTTGATGVALKTGRRALADGEIIIWDQATATARNPAVLAVWMDVTFDARYSSRNAYADGALLVGFTDTSRLDSMRVVPAPVLPFDRLAPDDPVIKATFGVPVTYSNHTLEYPDFKVRFYEREIFRRLQPEAAPRIYYKFRVFEKQLRRIDQIAMRSESFDEGNGRGLEFAGQAYLAEMIHTTAGLPADFSPGDKLPRTLPQDQIVFWNRASAGGNPRILKFWPSEAVAVQAKAGAGLSASRSGGYAAGESLQRLAGSNDVVGPLGYAEQLDSIPWIISKTDLIYPREFAGSGLVSRVAGWLSLTAEGAVARAEITEANDSRFAAVAAETLKRWRFTPPKRSGQPTVTLLRFSMDLFDDASHPQEFSWMPAPAN